MLEESNQRRYCISIWLQLFLKQLSNSFFWIYFLYCFSYRIVTFLSYKNKKTRSNFFLFVNLLLFICDFIKIFIIARFFCLHLTFPSCYGGPTTISFRNVNQRRKPPFNTPIHFRRKCKGVKVVSWCKVRLHNYDRCPDLSLLSFSHHGLTPLLLNRRFVLLIPSSTSFFYHFIQNRRFRTQREC